MEKLIPRPGSDEPAIAFEAVVTTGANSEDDDVYVARFALADPGEEPTLADGPCRWEPRVGFEAGEVVIRYPSRGDRALLIFSDEDRPWVFWWPYE